MLTLQLFPLLFSSELLALDKRLPIHNPAPQSFDLKINTVYAEQTSDGQHPQIAQFSYTFR